MVEYILVFQLLNVLTGEQTGLKMKPVEPFKTQEACEADMPNALEAIKDNLTKQGIKLDHIKISFVGCEDNGIPA